jgi:hypothetical protein
VAARPQSLRALVLAQPQKRPATLMTDTWRFAERAPQMRSPTWFAGALVRSSGWLSLAAQCRRSSLPTSYRQSHSAYDFMARFSVLALLALVSAGLALAGPAQEPLRTSLSDKSWDWTDCGRHDRHLCPWFCMLMTSVCISSRI